MEFKKEETEQSIPDRFEKIARSYPERLAVKTKTQAFTYNELNGIANRIARAILAQTGGGNEPIAILLEKGVAVIAAILGILKAGKIYVPLDPLFPEPRIASMLEDSQARLIVTNSRNFCVARELAQHGSRLLNIDDMDSDVSDENVGLSISPDTLAFIIYTSGSTGDPKGVVHNHRNVLHNVMNITNALHICAEDRSTLLASCSTAQAVTDMYCALLNGATLYVINIKEEGLTSLASWLIEEEITIYRSSASAFRTFTETLTGEERFPKLRLIKVGSEPVYRTDVELYKKHFSADCQFVNALSVTEALTVGLYVVNQQTAIFGTLVPVGHALADKGILLFDENQKQIGFNEIGEIAVKSRYLSPGYWQKPGLTQAAFLPNEGSEERIYFTGDMGRMLPDGCLEQLGRKDFQVEIRGHRIEVAEIEMALLEHNAIKQVIVLARKNHAADTLVAYVVAASRPAPNVSELRRFLNQKLPDYMIPALFVMVESLPLTPTGKIDRLALPAPSSARPELDAVFVAPRTPVERTLANIWAEVLSIDEVGVHDNFLDLGGHSLLATQIIARVYDAFDLEIPLRELLEKPTVADMAMIIVQRWAAQENRADLDSLVMNVKEHK